MCIRDRDYTVDKKATCTEEGEQSKHCTRKDCNGKEDIQKIPALGHDYVSKVTKESTCTEKGSLTTVSYTHLPRAGIILSALFLSE